MHISSFIIKVHMYANFCRAIQLVVHSTKHLFYFTSRAYGRAFIMFAAWSDQSIGRASFARRNGHIVAVTFRRRKNVMRKILNSMGKNSIAVYRNFTEEFSEHIVMERLEHFPIGVQCTHRHGATRTLPYRSSVNSSV